MPSWTRWKPTTFSAAWRISRAIAVRATSGPITLPGGNKNKKAQQQYSEIVSARFLAEAVEPHTTRAGFVFFDVAFRTSKGAVT